MGHMAALEASRRDDIWGRSCLPGVSSSCSVVLLRHPLCLLRCSWAMQRAEAPLARCPCVITAHCMAAIITRPSAAWMREAHQQRERGGDEEATQPAARQADDAWACLFLLRLYEGWMGPYRQTGQAACMPAHMHIHPCIHTHIQTYIHTHTHTCPRPAFCPGQRPVPVRRRSSPPFRRRIRAISLQSGLLHSLSPIQTAPAAPSLLLPLSCLRLAAAAIVAAPTASCCAHTPLFSPLPYPLP